MATIAYPVSAIPVVWDSNTTVANATIPIAVPPWLGGGTIESVTYYTGGTSTPSFDFAVEINGTPVTGGTGTASSSTPANTACTAGNTFTPSDSITLVISSVSGSPNQALVQINITTTLN